MSHTLPSTQDDTPTLGVELYGGEHQAWLAGNSSRGQFRDPGEPTIVRRRNGVICGVFGAVGTVEELDAVAARSAPTWTAFHVTPAVGEPPASGSKIWSCPNGCGYHIADGPVPDGEPSTLELIQEHLAEHDREAAPAPGPYAEVAAELHRIADALAGITGDQPALTARFSLSVPWQLRPAGNTPALVDAVAAVVVGQLGAAERCGSSWKHAASADRGPVHVWVHGEIPDPEDKDAELGRLRARVAELEAAAGEVQP